MTNNQMAHVKAIGSIIGTIIVIFLMIIVLISFPMEFFGIIVLCVASYVFYELYMIVYHEFGGK